MADLPVSSMAAVAQDLMAIFKIRRKKTAEALAEESAEAHEKSYSKAVAVFEAGIENALSPTFSLPRKPPRQALRATSMLERLFKEEKRRSRVVGIFPNETGAVTPATEMASRSSEEWALRRYLTMDALQGADKPTTFETLTEPGRRRSMFSTKPLGE